jgi:nucleoside-diphosphate-sugar epimerase
MSTSAVVFGGGYLGLRVAARWQRAGRTVYVVTRSGPRAAELAERGLLPIVADVTRPDSLAGLPAAEAVLWAVGFDRGAGVPLEAVYVEGLRAALAALPAETGRVIYTSSTGVYGQSGGAWVDEHSECAPRRAGGRACLDAERLLAAHRLGRCAVVLRLAGLYGPGRIPRAADVAGGVPLAVRPDTWLNLIHVEDAAAAVCRAEELAAARATLVVSDSEPVLRGDYYRELARLYGAPPPEFAGGGGETAARRGSSDQRVDSRRSRAALGLELRYPTYREGLPACLDGAAECL